MSASQQESAALKWGGLAVLVAVAAATIVAVFTMLFGGKGQPNEQPRLPPANSRLPQDYWHALGMIEQGYRNAPKPDETLAEAQKYDEFTANCGRCADSSGALAEKLRALPIAGVDAELIDYSLALASFYQHKAALYRRVGQFGSDMKTYRSKIVGPAAFMRGLLRPDKAIDDLFGA